MDKLKVYQKIYKVPEFTRNFMDVILSPEMEGIDVEI